MTYIEKLQSVVSTLAGSPAFMPAEDLFNANIRIEDFTFPIVMVLPNGLTNLSVKTQVIQDGGIALWFAEMVDVDVAYSVKRACWDRMYVLASEFLVKAGLSEHFFAPTEVTKEETFDKFDVNICGVVLYMKLKERSGLNVCDLSNFPPVVTSAIAELSTGIVLIFSKTMNQNTSLSLFNLWVDGLHRNIVDVEFVDDNRCAITFDPPQISAGQSVYMAITRGLLATDGTIFQGATFTVTNEVV